MSTDTKTMTTWGAYIKLEAIAAAAERINLPGRADIRARVEAILAFDGTDEGTQERLHAAAIAWRGELGGYAPRVASYLDSALDALLEYLERPQVKLSGSELLDQLIGDGAGNVVTRETDQAERRYRLAHLY